MRIVRPILIARLLSACSRPGTLPGTLPTAKVPRGPSTNTKYVQIVNYRLLAYFGVV